MRNSGIPLCRVPSTSPPPLQPQILFGDDEPVLGAAHHVQSLARRVRQRLAVEQDTRRLLGAASDPAAQLVQLRQPEALGMIDDHDRGVRHVDADLDHRGGDQDRQRARRERRHDAILVLAGELAMHQPDPLAEARAQLGMPLLRGGDVQHLGLGDQRADPVDLRAGGERRARPLRSPRQAARAGRYGLRSASCRAASRRAATRPCRHSSSAAACAESASPSSPAARRRCRSLSLAAPTVDARRICAARR